MPGILSGHSGLRIIGLPLQVFDVAFGNDDLLGVVVKSTC